MSGGANSAKIAEIREAATALRDDRDKGYPPPSFWGPTCHGCGTDSEFRHDGYCSMECRDWHNDDEAVEVARDVLVLVEIAEAAQAYFDSFAAWEKKHGAKISLVPGGELARLEEALTKVSFDG